MLKKITHHFSRLSIFKNGHLNNGRFQKSFSSEIKSPGVSKERDYSVNTPPDIPQDTSLKHAVHLAQQGLLLRQHEEGYWEGELYADTTLTSDYILMTHFMKSVNLSRQMKAVHFLFNEQQEDGSWNIFHEGAGNPSATIKAYFALKLAGISKNDSRMQKARKFILKNGGIESANIFTKIYLAMFGQYEWYKLPVMPVEMMFIPSFLYVNIYEISCWSRDIVVPLFVINARKPIVQIPQSSYIHELKNGKTKNITHFDHADSFWGQFFTLVDRTLKFCGKLPVKPFRKIAIRKAEKWILVHLKDSDGLGAIYPAMLNSMFALKLLGYDNKHPAMKKIIRTFNGLIEESDKFLYLKPCLSPVWDTAFTLKSLVESGIPKHHPGLQKSVNWLLSKQVRSKGDWSIKRKRLEPGGWYFQFANGFYPDNDDTAVVLMALRHFINLNGDSHYTTHSSSGNPALNSKKVSSINSEDVQSAVQRGVDWLFGMQCKNGGWGAFEVDNNRTILNNLPWADYGALLDPATPDITGRVLQILGYMGKSTGDPEISRSISFLIDSQEPGGSWYGRWGVNYIYGTWSVLMGLSAVKEDMNSDYVKKSVEWLLSVQNKDGGWGESCLSYADKNWMGVGQSTPSQTSWALLGLMAAGLFPHAAIDRGIDYLVRTQRRDGLWDEKFYTGTGFPQVLYLRYQFYPFYFPLMALSEYRYLKQRSIKVKEF